MRWSSGLVLTATLLAGVSSSALAKDAAAAIAAGRDAQSRPCRLEARRLKEATAWMERYRSFWEESFARLDGLLDELKRKEKSRARHEQPDG